MAQPNSPHGDAEREARYRRFAQEFGAALVRVACAYEADTHKREDLLQEIHVALWRSIDGFNGTCSDRTWVYRVAHNVAISHAMRDRRSKRIPLVTLDELAEVADDANHERDADASSTLARLQRLIQALKPIDRQIIILYLEDLEAHEIGDIVGLSAGNVATKIHRIKKILAARFDGAAHE